MLPEQRSNYDHILAELETSKARLIAISKTHPVQSIQEYYDLGQRDFGENRVSELIEKQAVLPDDIRWHFIGHLQRNKVKNVVEHVDLIHSIDSERLLREVNKQAANRDLKIDVLLQFHIADEESKYGLTYKVAQEMLRKHPAESLPGVRIIGVMGMATYTDNDEQIATEFDRLTEIFKAIRAEFFPAEPAFKEISMGMSGDYPLAIQRGSTMVRVGSLLFGERNYG